MNVTLVKNGVVKDVKVGFSWTTLFFCPINLVFRGEWLLCLGLAVLMILINLIVPAGGLVNIVYAFFANKVTARRMIAEGWLPLHPEDVRVHQALAKWEVQV